VDWKYYIPHVWDGDRQIWEDIYVLPIDARYNGNAVWLTIDAVLAYRSHTEVDFDLAESPARTLQRLGNRDFHIDGTDMLVRAEDFSKEELLDWVRVWLRENDLAVDNLIEGNAEEFKGKAFHVDLVKQLKAGI
jgi:hypothetical protein